MVPEVVATPIIRGTSRIDYLIRDDLPPKVLAKDSACGLGKVEPPSSYRIGSSEA